MIDRENRVKQRLEDVNKYMGWLIKTYFVAGFWLFTYCCLQSYHYGISISVYRKPILLLIAFLAILTISNIWFTDNEPARLVFGFDYYKELNVHTRYAYAFVANKKREHIKYTEWRNHIVNKYEMLIGSIDFCKYLNTRMRVLKMLVDALKTVSLPFVVAELTVFYSIISTSSFDNFKVVSAIVFVFSGELFIVGSMISGLCKEIFFIEDLLDIIAPIIK